MEEKEKNVLDAENNLASEEESYLEEAEQTSKEETDVPLTDEDVEESYEDDENEILNPTEAELEEAEKETEAEEKYAEKTEDQVVNVRAKNLNTARWEELEDLLAEGSIKIWEALNLSHETYERIKKNNERIYPRKALIIGGLLKHCTWVDILNVKHKLPKGTTVIRKTEKIQILAKILRENHNLTFARAISISDKRSKFLQAGHKLPTARECRRITTYFLMSPKYFMDDNLDLPPVEKIKIDETIASIQRNDFENEVKLEKNKHYIRRNWQILSHGKRMRLLLHLGLTIVPLAAFTAGCAYTIIKDRAETLEKYDKKHDGNEQKVTSKEVYSDGYASYDLGDSFEDAINKSPKVVANKDYIANINIGAQLVKIGNISPSTSSYGVAMRMWMDFDTIEYHEMLRRKADPSYSGSIDEIKQSMYAYSASSPQSGGQYNPEKNPVPDKTAEEAMKYDLFSFNDVTREFEFKGNTTNYGRDAIGYDENQHEYYKDPKANVGDGIPDYMQIANFSPDMYVDYARNANAPTVPAQLSPNYEKERAQYPLETSSDNYPDKETMFIVGNGEIDAHSFSYEVAQDYTLTDDFSGEVEYRFFSCCYFDATIRKAFDNPRYPLDSVQFHIYIMPMQLLVENARYCPTDKVALNTAGHQTTEEHKTCSIEGQTFTTGVSPVFMMSSGYKLLKNSNYSNFITRNYYYTDENYKANPDWSQFKTEYEIVVRANRQGLNLFLQAFMNLFCVTVWITIAFYSQSHQGENQLGMMGTGLFAGISSILVGLSMVSDAGIISMITMINVFTLAVILIMTANCIEARTYQVKEDVVGQAFNGIKMRIMFYILLACTLIMFIGLPICGYLWFL